ncbi:hypothetical protein QE386_000958 [Pseudoxanthomonas winnipegensis]|nr:hypothetical protein [Pseudoxanthomonas winnipegensis]
MGQRGAGDQDRFAQGHDHEQRAALDQMAAFDGPLARAVRPAQAGHGEAEHRRDVLARHRQAPQQQPPARLGQATADPQRRAQDGPGQDAAEVRPQRMVAQLQAQEQRSPHLHDRIAAGEQQSALAEGLRQRGGEQQPHAHQREQHHPDRPGLRVEPVGHPAGVLPAQPDREPQQQRLGRPQHGQMPEQEVRDLGDGEHVDQVEEQFGVADLGLTAIAHAQQRMRRGRGRDIAYGCVPVAHGQTPRRGSLSASTQASATGTRKISAWIGASSSSV